MAGFFFRIITFCIQKLFVKNVCNFTQVFAFWDFSFVSEVDIDIVNVFVCSFSYFVQLFCVTHRQRIAFLFDIEEWKEFRMMCVLFIKIGNNAFNVSHWRVNEFKELVNSDDWLVWGVVQVINLVQIFILDEFRVRRLLENRLGVMSDQVSKNQFCEILVFQKFSEHVEEVNDVPHVWVFKLFLVVLQHVFQNWVQDGNKLFAECFNVCIFFTFEGLNVLLLCVLQVTQIQLGHQEFSSKVLTVRFKSWVVLLLNGLAYWVLCDEVCLLHEEPKLVA